MITETIARKVLEVVDAGLVAGLGKPIPGEMCVEAAVCYAMGLPHGDQPDCVSPALRKLKITLNDACWSSTAARTAGLRRLALAQLGSAGVLDEKEFTRRVADLVIRKVVPFALRAAGSIEGNGAFTAALAAAAGRCERDGTIEAARHAHKMASAAAAYANAANAANAAADAADAADAAAAAAAYAAAAAANAANAADAAAAAYANAANAANAADAANAAYANAAYAAAAAANAANAGDKFLTECCESVVQILIQMNAPGCQWLALTEAA